MASGENETLPVGDLARILNLSERRVQQLATEGVIPRVGRGRYDLSSAVQGYITFLQDGGGGASPAPGELDYHHERARKTKAEADIAEIEAASRRGEVAPVWQFQKATEKAYAEVQTRMLAIPARASRMIVGETNESRIKSVLRDEICQALEALASASLVSEDDLSDHGPDAAR